MIVSIKSAVEGWQSGKLTDNEFVNQMNFCGCSSISSSDGYKTFSQKNQYGSDVVFEVYSEKFHGSMVMLTGYTVADIEFERV